jgi:tRNA (cytidine/uridine-2'-O-)-methyltransferase
LGFDVGEKAARRAGIDHWAHVDRVDHANEQAFWQWAEHRRVHLFSSHGERPYTEACFQEEDVLLFGCESTGLPKALVQERGAWRIPMLGNMRALNLSNAVAVAAYRALGDIQPGFFVGPQ